MSGVVSEGFDCSIDGALTENLQEFIDKYKGKGKHGVEGNISKTLSDLIIASSVSGAVRLQHVFSTKYNIKV